MNEPLIIGAVVVIVLACCLLGILIYKVGYHLATSVSLMTNSVGQSRHDFVKFSEGLQKAAEHIAPVRDIQCTKCGGTGVVEKENPLWTALAEALEANTAAARKGRK
jgi:hypothetical protein